MLSSFSSLSTPPFLSPLLSEPLPASLWLPLAAIAGAGLDRLLGEARHWHPLVGFGALAGVVENVLNTPQASKHAMRWRGLLAWAVVVLPCVLLATWLTPPTASGWIVDVVLLYLALGGRSLAEHASQVAQDLASGDLAAARLHVGWIVSRDTTQLDASEVAKAGVESTLENGNDAVFGALFWFALLGGAGAVLFRLANTLDAMWGYKSERYLHFGWAAARIDDALNYVPARLTALSYALFGRPRRAWACWQRQAARWESPNAGPVMAAGAGSLCLRLGGEAIYHGRLEHRPPLGFGPPPRGEDIGRALTLVRRSLVLWLALFLCWGIARA
jgi:adenosylcobinamide-phosphate synthase